MNSGETKLIVIDTADGSSIWLELDHSEGLLKLVVHDQQAQPLASLELEPNQAEAVASTLRIFAQESRLPSNKKKTSGRPQAEGRLASLTSVQGGVRS